MKVIDRVRSVVTRAIPSKLVKSKLHRAVASFTFDDFPKCAWTEGGPVLRAYDARATYYVAGSRCGTVADGTRQFDRDDLVALAEAGHEIGCHSFAHRPVRSVSSRELCADIARNAAFVRDVIGPVALESYAYPHGDVGPRTKLLHGRLFASSRGIRSGVNAGMLDLALLKVVPIHEIAHRPALLDEVIETATARAGWIIFLTHDVQDHPEMYGCTPRTLARTLEAMRTTGIEILPVKEALARATGAQTLH